MMKKDLELQVPLYNYRLLIFLCICFLVFLFNILHQNQSAILAAYSIVTTFSINRNLSELKKDNPILILAWTPYQWDKSLNGIPWEKLDPPLFFNCPSDLNCVITSNRSLFNSSDAILFHASFLKWIDTPSAIDRRSDQYFVFAQWEPPENTIVDLSSEKFKYFFNLTMTYRSDSDVFWPYGKFQYRPFLSIDFDRLSEMIKNKTKLLAWFVSDCQTPSARETLVDDLQTYLKVDVYGKCGRLECPLEKKLDSKTALGTKRNTFCNRMLTTEYKFYLALENSLCKDYVTEKFFERMSNSLIVPIVLERSIVIDTVVDSKIKEALNRSFIAVDDFAKVEQLADYLKYLDKNSTAYMEFFEWRRDYEIVFENQYKPGCDFCKMVTERKRKTVDIYEWWHKEAACHSYTSRLSQKL